MLSYLGQRGPSAPLTNLDMIYHVGLMLFDSADMRLISDVDRISFDIVDI